MADLVTATAHPVWECRDHEEYTKFPGEALCSVHNPIELPLVAAWTAVAQQRCSNAHQRVFHFFCLCFN